MKALRTLLAAVLLTGTSVTGTSGATDVPLQVSDPGLRAAVQDALKALSDGQNSYALVNGQGPVFVLGGAAAFSPDVASRSFGGASPRVEFNPQGPLPLGEAVQAELRRLLGLKAPDPASQPTAGTSTVGTSTAGASTAGASTAGTSTSGGSVTGASTTGTSSVGTSTSGASTTGASATPAPVKAGPGDLNGDGVVDTGDLAILMGNLGKTGKNLPGDLNGDGRVDQQDLEAFSKLYRLP